MKVVAISGQARHGKDTAARIMREQLERDGHKVLITHYGDLLKYICKAFLGWDGKKDRKGRSLLQHVGTDIVRVRSPNYWVDFVVDILSFFDGYWDYVIIPDVRFPNELSRLKDGGLDMVHIRIVRPDFVSQLTAEQQTHPSEIALNEVQPDYCIWNAGGLEELKTKIINWIREDLYA